MAIQYNINNGKFIETTSVNSNFTSNIIEPRFNVEMMHVPGVDYSIQLIASGIFNVDLELQVSLDKENWTTISDSVIVNKTVDDFPVLYDVRTGDHPFVRVFIAFNSGTMDTLEGYYAS